MATRYPQNAGSTHPAAPASAANTFRGPEIKVTLDPPNKVFFISADARMPKIKATCQLPSPTPALSGQTNSPWAAVQGYDWDVTVVLNPAGVPYAVGRSTRHIPMRFTTLLPELTLPFTQIRGGTLTVVVATILQGQRVTGKTVAEIRGTNPSATLIRSEAVPEILMKLMKLESRLQQFLTTHSRAGYPVFSHDGLGGAGLGQITHPRPTDDEVWDWKANVKATKAQWESKRRNDAEKHLRDYATGQEFRALAQAFNDQRTTPMSGAQKALLEQAGKPPPVPLKALTITLPPITDEMIDNETLRLYNGEPRFKNTSSLREYRAKIDEKGLLVVDVMQDGLHGKARWQQVTADERRAFYNAHTKKAQNGNNGYIGDSDYVSHVRSQVVN